MKPITRKEMLMAKAAGQTVPDLEPITREEIFLAKAAGMDVPELEPVTRNEWFISQISGGSGGGGDAVHINYDAETFKIDKSYNDLLAYSNSGKMVFFITAEENEGESHIAWFPILGLHSTTSGYSANFGTSDYNFTFLSDDPDEPMLEDY